MPTPPSVAQLAQSGLTEAQAAALAPTLDACFALEQAAIWPALTQKVLRPQHPFATHRLLFERAYAAWPSQQGPPPAWIPSSEQIQATHMQVVSGQLGVDDAAGLVQYAATQRAAFWRHMVLRLGIAMERPWEHFLKPDSDPKHPSWLHGARLNIAASCLQGPTDQAAVVGCSEDGRQFRLTYGQLQALAGRVANGLRQRGLGRGDAIGVALPMTPEAVAIYLGIVLSGGIVVAIADSFAADQIGLRLRLGKAKAVFTQHDIHRGGKTLPLYPRLQEADAPPAIVLGPPAPLRQGDWAWDDFLGDSDVYEPVAAPASSYTNILFSSGTTGDPKAIPWTQTTPLKCAVDGHLLQDIHPDDVVCWPTNLGWMMGPWLIYAALINRATIALYDGLPSAKGFARFVQDHRVTVLGTIPSLVRQWRSQEVLADCDWTGVRLISSTGECSDPDDMFYLMGQAGYRPLIEYCGGTELGGGYIATYPLRPCAPSCFHGPTPGLDMHILDEDGRPADRGEVFLGPPSIGFSTQLVNGDHDQVYYQGTPPHPETGAPLRRHGDAIERLPNGFYRAQGRVDDAMNLGGIKVSAAEIEAVVRTLSGIDEVAAIAVPPAAGGPDRLVLFAVSQRPAAELLDGSRQAVRQRLNPLFHIDDLCLVPSLPRTASNKIMRRVLRQQYASRKTT